MARRFYIVDVFAERPYTGNPLAVVVGGDDLSTETMQQFAAEMNYSETSFVASASEHDGGYRVRIFTPAREIAFAEHPILGTAWVVRHRVAPEASGPVRLNLAVGQVPVTFESFADSGEVAWFLAPPVLLGATLRSGTDRSGSWNIAGGHRDQGPRARALRWHVGHHRSPAQS